MVFSSLNFIFIFLPVFLLVYYIVPIKLRNLCLFTGSVIFYSYGVITEPFYIVLILLSVLINFLAGCVIKKYERFAKTAFILGVIYNFSWLFIFKYADFFAQNINNLIDFISPLSKVSLPLTNLIMPIGISFYTFQMVSYLADVYRKKVEAETSIVRLGAYITMFPQLIAGPIVRFEDVAQSLKVRSYNLKNLAEGAKPFVMGLGLKVLLANQLGNLWQDVNTIGFESISTPLAWMGIIAYSMQIYFDFYGYSLMAMGLGKMLGFSLPENFNVPYISVTMTEFWRRWHITLGSWFREYVYIPLGGNRKGKARTYINLFIVWALTGLWHGASWNFVIWGIGLFVIISIEKLFIGDFFNKFRIVGHIYMILLIPLSWLIFAVTDIKQVGIYFGRLINLGGINVFSLDYIKYGKIYGVLLIVGLVMCTGLPIKIYRKIKDSFVILPVMTAMFGASIYCLYMGLNDPFMYFRF